MEKQWEKSSANSRSNNEDRSFQDIGQESREDQNTQQPSSKNEGSGQGSEALQGSQGESQSSSSSQRGSESSQRSNDSSQHANESSQSNGSSMSGSSGSNGANGQNKSLSNMAYNWVTFVQNKARAVKSYEQYISDAEEAGETECAELFRQACKADQEQLGQAKQHLSSMLQASSSGN